MICILRKSSEIYITFAEVLLYIGDKLNPSFNTFGLLINLAASSAIFLYVIILLSYKNKKTSEDALVI